MRAQGQPRGLVARALALLAFAAFVFAPRSARAGDPYIAWYTLKSPHFHVHYHAGLESVAQKAASVAEDVYSRLVPALGWKPKEITEIVLTDDANNANGFASTLPYSRITLFVTAPNDMSGLGDYDDWLTELITHEYTHIVHTDNVSGAPASSIPSSGPRCTKSGSAELDHRGHRGCDGNRAHDRRPPAFEPVRHDASRGRARGQHRAARSDQQRAVSLAERNLWYLYGAHFVAWIASIYGPDIYSAVAADYGAQLIPFGVNRAIRRATGRTYEELYAGFVADLERQVAAEAVAIERIGRREGRRLTFAGRGALGPRFRPPGCGGRSLAYHRDGEDDPIGVYEIPMDGKPVGGRAELRALAFGRSVAFLPDCSMIFDHIEPSRRGYAFTELVRQPDGTRSPGGYEKNRERLTFGRRAREPDASADGRHVVYVTDRSGTSTLRIAELTPSYRLENERRLAPSANFEQVFTPRFSPDGTKVAYGVWTDGGYRDLRIVNVRSGELVELWHDRAFDQQPAWSPDGKTLYFTSDRSGFPNVFAYDVESRALHQVTNVLTGAYMPEPSPDGRSLVYVGYTTDGYDLFEIGLDPARFLPAHAPFDARPKPRGRPFSKKYPVERYNPFPSLRPRNWAISYGTGAFGNAFTVSTTGTDAIARHAFTASLTVETEEVTPLGFVNYIYSRLPFGFRTTGFRAAAPRDDYRIGETEETVIEYQTGLTTGVAFGMPGDGEFQSIALSYTLAFIDHQAPLGSDLDPFAPVPFEPDSGVLGDVRLGYDFSNASATPMAISLERGLRVGVAGDFADPAWGSEYTLTAMSGVLAAYVPMPWLRHHVLAFGLSGAIAMGTYVARSGLYYTGGFADGQSFDGFTTGIRQGAFVLRGYEPAQFSGTTYNLMNVEYRFPIAYVNRGLSTLPVFVRSLAGVLFVDYGGAYYEMDMDHPLDVFHAGVGAELWINLVLGYGGFVDARLGVARGLDHEAPSGLQTYFVLASGF